MRKSVERAHPHIRIISSQFLASFAVGNDELFVLIFDFGNVWIVPRMSQLLEMCIHSCILEIASRDLDEFMRQYMRQIAVGMVSFFPFRLNVDNPLRNLNRKISNRMQNFAMQFIVQRLKRISRMHAKALNKQINVSVIHIPLFRDDHKFSISMAVPNCDAFDTCRLENNWSTPFLWSQGRSRCRIDIERRSLLRWLHTVP